MFAKDLNAILALFERAIASLENFAARQSQHAVDKHQRAQALAAEATDHRSSADRAVTIASNFRALLAK